MRNTFINKINSVIASIETGDYQDALDKLQNDIINKADGVATIGQPDSNDWIKDPASQTMFYNDCEILETQLKSLIN